MRFNRGPQLAHRTGLIREDDALPLIEAAEEVGRMLRGLIASLERSR